MLYEHIKKEKYLFLPDGSKFDWNDKLIISGPCSFGSYDEIYEIAKELKERNVIFIRGGVFKMRTSPYSFQGLRDEGIDILLKIKKELDIKIVVELTTIEQVKKYGNMIDIIQIGTRNMYNYELLKEVGKTNTPVILKRSFCASYKEWFLAAEYILKEGNKNVILCERGIKNTFSEETRNVLDIQAIPFVQHNTNFRIIIDPSHASGHEYMVESTSKGALACGCDGLLIECHIEPKKSLSDAKQTINFKQLDKILDFKERIKNED